MKGMLIGYLCSVYVFGAIGAAMAVAADKRTGVTLSSKISVVIGWPITLPLLVTYLAYTKMIETRP